MHVAVQIPYAVWLAVVTPCGGPGTGQYPADLVGKLHMSLHALGKGTVIIAAIVVIAIRHGTAGLGNKRQRRPNGVRQQRPARALAFCRQQGGVKVNACGRIHAST